MNKSALNRRSFLKAGALGAASVLFGGIPVYAKNAAAQKSPNIVYLFADQWRAQDTGYAGNPDVITPNIDTLARNSVNFRNAVSGCPVCSPYRASLLTGQYPLTHGVFVNDVPLRDDAITVGEIYKNAGYETGYIGKWHLDGRGRSSFIPRERRKGFDFWKVLECTHDYNNSFYFADANVKLRWRGYDAIAQTREAETYIRGHAHNKNPFILFLSWGPPHAPYLTAPEEYRQLFNNKRIVLRPNVPESEREKALRDIAGYYAHMAVLDECVGRIWRTLREEGIEEDTILVFTSDHGDMLYSHGEIKKQRPYDESIRVPFLLRYPRIQNARSREITMPISTPDILPTLLGISGLEIPDSIQGNDFSRIVAGGKEPRDHAALISCPSPFGQWTRKMGGREYRGLRTDRYTYVRDLNGPWLLYDNERDPYQLVNLCHSFAYTELRAGLDRLLSEKLKEINDEFLPGEEYIKKWGYEVDEEGTVPYWKYDS